MHSILYHIALGIYHLIIFTLYPFYPKAKQYILGRKNWKEKLNGINFKDCDWIWVHFSSFGEYQDGKFSVNKLKEEFPATKFLYTFHSPSGYEALKNKNEADYLCYIPFDYKYNAEYFIKTINPKCIIFCRNDIWYNYIKFAKKKEIPVIHLSTLIGINSGFLKFPQIWHYKKAFCLFDLLLTQNISTKNILENIFNAKNAVLIGNTRIDSIFDRFEKNTQYPEIKKFIGSEFCIVGGSLLKKDIENLTYAYHKLKTKRIKWIIIPHEINNLSFIMSNLSKDKILLYSEIDQMKNSHEILIVDCVGILMDLYQYANLTYIGGGFNKIGIHNILEPCMHGNKIIIGPNHRNYPEAIDLINLNICEVIKDKKKLYQKIDMRYEGRDESLKDSRKAKHYVSSKRGASAESIIEIKTLLLKKNVLKHTPISE